MRSAFYGLSFGVLASAAAAQEGAERIPSHCQALAQETPGVDYLWKAAVGEPLPEDTVRIHYIAHAMLAIEAGDISAVTDFNGYIGATGWLPDVVTMNHAHSSHYTTNVPEGIPHVLEGWGEFGKGAEHDLDLGAMRIRNVTTDIRMGGGREESGNSIFLFEAAGLCIGHLGHLHQEPSEEQYAAIGRVDVLMAPVDGGYTIPVDLMARIVERMRSSIVIPMHWFSRYGLERFLDEMGEQFQVIETQGPELLVSLDRLPQRPTIMVLEPQMLSD
ncbi:MBL fold metallo-hydrolase [Celeribacter indicus]|uniref:Zn-dependent hydrolase n=1 Tax=Celeribacter indicus TaxID=1208324 RepID=A0A0B5DR00_9RHOB|nr:MBL fold metallo-hydrolase [Celeribacter indicus]AJE45953.1 hypothetical protein P73_1238 [Celeribacter indicus]SDW64615.1 L-ascorbate metabolism protein UlaG, beta-lactamase superfamily [Celeribacter indicus]